MAHFIITLKWCTELCPPHVGRAAEASGADSSDLNGIKLAFKIICP
jgi:hypothetical protein